MISLFITLCKMVSVRACLSVAEEVERYMVPKSRFGSFGKILWFTCLNPSIALRHQVEREKNKYINNTNKNTNS